MAQWDFTLIDPDANPSTKIPDVVIPCDRESGYTREMTEEIKVERFTNQNTAIKTGVRVGARYTWTIEAQMKKSDAVRLGGMIRKVMEASSYLYLIDEVRELDPETSPHSKTLIGTPTAVGYANLYNGYGKFAVFPRRQGSFRSIGKSGDEYTDLVRFDLIELPNVAVS